MTIKIEKRGETLILTGATYQSRFALKDRGARWNSAAKSWTLSATPDNERWARETLGATDAFKVVEKEVAKDSTSLSVADFERIKLMIDKAIGDGASGTDEAALAAIVDTAVTARTKALQEQINRTRTLTVQTEFKRVEIKGLVHPLFETLLKSLGAGLHVWISGPSGSGKTHGAEQAAKALGLTFELQGAMTMAHELTGFVDAGGRYHTTPFVRAFRDGGLILLDEIDAGSNEALLALNAALANGVMSLPSGDVVRGHKDFKCIGAANTFGNGATAEYVGRVRIDQAFLQRFGARLDWGYDEKLETLISGNEAWSKRVQRARANAKRNGLKVMITPRASQAGAKLIAAGMTPDEAAGLTYLAGLTPDQRAMLEA